jgi:hypothetical protein
LIWVERLALGKLTDLRGAGESWSDVILPLAEMKARGLNL